MQCGPTNAEFAFLANDTDVHQQPNEVFKWQCVEAVVQPGGRGGCCSLMFLGVYCTVIWAID